MTLAWPFTIFRLHRNPRLDELKHFIIVHFNVGWVLFCGVNLDTECVCVCVWFFGGADETYVTGLPNVKHAPFLQPH